VILISIFCSILVILLLNSVSFSSLSISPVVTRVASGSCIDHVLTKLPSKMVDFCPFFAGYF
jgi:hypothetical protein